MMNQINQAQTQIILLVFLGVYIIIDYNIKRVQNGGIANEERQNQTGDAGNGSDPLKLASSPPSFYIWGIIGKGMGMRRLNWEISILARHHLKSVEIFFGKTRLSKRRFFK